MALEALKSASAQQIGYAAMTVLIILAFLFQAASFSFNSWYRIQAGPFGIRCGLWEIKVYDENNVTGLDGEHHRRAEFRFYDENWKAVLDKMKLMAATKPMKRRLPARRRDDNDDDDDENEHFKPGENWFTLPKYIPETTWDKAQSNLNSAEALFSISWLTTFVLMCLFAFHQFVPNFEITITVMRLFCGTLFFSGFFTLIASACYGSALPGVCEDISSAYANSPNPTFATAASAVDTPCSFGNSYTLAIFSGLFLIITGIMAAVHIRRVQQGGGAIDLGSLGGVAGVAGTALSLGKSLLNKGGGQSGQDYQPPGGETGYNAVPDWQQEPTTYASEGYNQGGYGY